MGTKQTKGHADWMKWPLLSVVVVSLSVGQNSMFGNGESAIFWIMYYVSISSIKHSAQFFKYKIYSSSLWKTNIKSTGLAPWPEENNIRLHSFLSPSSLINRQRKTLIALYRHNVHLIQREANRKSSKIWPRSTNKPTEFYKNMLSFGVHLLLYRKYRSVFSAVILILRDGHF